VFDSSAIPVQNPSAYSTSSPPPSTEIVSTIAPTPVPTANSTPVPSKTTAPTAPPSSDPAVSNSVSSSESSSESSSDIESYFNNCAFVGDSVTEGLAQYVRLQRENKPTLGDAKFLTTTIGIRLADCAGDMGSDTLFFSFKGSERPLEECISEMGVDKVFIMMGMNDLEAGFSVSDTIDRYNRTLDKIYAAVPGVRIIVELNTPKTATEWLPPYCANKDFGNALIDEFNEAVIKMCGSRGLAYVDLNSILKDGNNAMPDDYSRDGYVHLSNDGAKIVVDALYDFAEKDTRGEIHE